MSPSTWGVRTRNGKYVLEDLTIRLCPLCRRLEVTTWEQGVFTRLAYRDETPVLHKRP